MLEVAVGWLLRSWFVGTQAAQLDSIALEKLAFLRADFPPILDQFLERRLGILPADALTAKHRRV